MKAYNKRKRPKHITKGRYESRILLFNNFSWGTRETDTVRSIRSSNGPDNLF